ncbi:methyltransferase family protein [Ruminiclostridium sufflavum DSM 19573]|uniref:Methyltransferase family protein n=1 Tax=Ruminiclostridium sufflavum DSM 19573 TaxID=1121337 RepID=A0A318XTL5_9FIRM|nr:methyltransferase [Ruminiclostridium sufflavum]PYG85682.1 methyltransferase family protein [Ruminiclostridium sufflavum DSM 19573]
MSQHYYSENPESDIKEKAFAENLSGIQLSFTSVSGVFSFGTRIDKASCNLIKSFSPSGSAVLDIGCGYGAIGLYIKALFPEQKVAMIDVNNRALEYSRNNSKTNNLKVEVINSNLFSSLSDRIFDDIVSNPPIAAGKELNIRLISEAYEHLSDNGSLWLVAFHNKGGSTLKNTMMKVFGNVKDMDKSGGIRVYKSIKKI